MLERQFWYETSYDLTCVCPAASIALLGRCTITSINDTSTMKGRWLQMIAGATTRRREMADLAMKDTVIIAVLDERPQYAIQATD